MSTAHTEPSPEPVNDQQKCFRCGWVFSIDAEEIWLAPDPFAEEVYGDCTPVWECHTCREESAEEV